MIGNLSYEEMDTLAESVAIGSEGLTILPFGNGAERMLGNRNVGAKISGIDFNRHARAHICRAIQEGIVFSFQYGLEAMRETGIDPTTIRAGFANMFMSDVFCNTLSGISGTTIELYDTDGALGAARGAGIGAGIYNSFDEAFASLKKQKSIAPNSDNYGEAYKRWKDELEKMLI